MHVADILRFVVHLAVMLGIARVLMFVFSLRRIRALVKTGCLVTALVVGVLAYDWTAQGEPQSWAGWLLAMAIAGSRARHALAQSSGVVRFFVPDVPESR